MGRAARIAVSMLVAAASLTAGAAAATASDNSSDPSDWKSGCSGTWALDTLASADYSEAAQEAFYQLGAKAGIAFTQLPDGSESADIYIQEKIGLTAERGVAGRAWLANRRIDIAEPDAITSPLHGTGTLGRRLDYQLRRNILEHEILHILGSPHTEEVDSIMNATANSHEQFGPFELGQLAHVADINGCAPWEAEASKAMKEATQWQSLVQANLQAKAECLNQQGTWRPTGAQSWADQGGECKTQPAPLSRAATWKAIRHCATHGGSYNTATRMCNLRQSSAAQRGEN